MTTDQDDASGLVQRAKKLPARLPPPDQLALYGALGVLAALSVINWPVALAIGAGTAVVARRVNARSPDKPAPRKATPKAD